jgi:hypothetical protein
VNDAAGAEARLTLWPANLTMAWFGCILAVVLLSVVATFFDAAPGIADVFMKEQDLAVAVATAIVLLMLRSIPASWAPVDRLAALGARLTPRPVVVTAAAFAAVVGVAGWFLVMRGYPLSTDEFMAGFDAGIFRMGRLFATVPAEWGALRFPIQPQFVLLAQDGASWSSSYLPVNAMALALFDRLGSQALAGAFWALVTVAAVWSLARRFWPERPAAHIVAVVLLVTGAQFLFGGMTRYAMSAHLALNMVWLWLFLRNTRLSHMGAVVVAFAACGLHQVVFHPLFAGPFLLELLLARRWGRAAFYALAYAFIGLFWISYWNMVMPIAAGQATGTGLEVWIVKAKDALDNFNATSMGMMAKNLLRFLTWQNPLLPALAVVAAIPAWKLGNPFRPMVLGLIGMLAVVFAIMPYQGHGWGYRYLHGYLGTMALLAALGWMRASDAMTPERRRAAGVGFAVVAAFCVLVLLPWRAVQAGGFIRPWVEAERAIQGAKDVDVVIVDATGMWFAADLVRNDPWLTNAPKVMDLVVMREAHIRAVCSRYSVAVFDRASGSDLRPVTYPRRNLVRLAENRRLMRELGCGNRRVVVR